MSSTSRRSGAWIAIGLVMAAVVAGLLLFARRAPKFQYDRETALRLVELRNLSLGQLENEQLAECDPLLQEIADRLPQDPFGPRNLAIARLLALQQTGAATDPEKHAVAARDARAAVERLQTVDGDAAIVHVLRSRVERTAEGDEPRGMADLQQAASLAPDEAWIAYELFQAGRFSNDAVVQAQARGALHRAAALQPDNVWLLIELLPLQAEEQSPEVAENLARLAELVQPFAATISRQTRVDIIDFLEQARQAATAGNWPVVLQRVRVVGNVLRPDPLAQADKLRVDRHPLALVIPDFRAEFYSVADLPPPAASDAIPVAFITSAAPLDPPILDVQDVQLGDFNLDGRSDVVLLHPDEVIALGTTTTNAPWQFAVEVPPGVSRLLVADLDDDVDANAAAPLNQADATSCRHADRDVIAWGAGGMAVLENRLDPATSVRSFAAVPQDAAWEAIRNVQAAELVDFDHDGDLDVALVADGGLELWSNRGNLTFEDISARSALPEDVAGIATLRAVDWDDDLDVDLLLLGNGPPGWMENLRHGRMRYRALQAPKGFMGGGAWELGDFDNNRTWDLISASDGGVTLYRGHFRADGGSELGEAVRLSADRHARVVVLDYDNDALLDVIAHGDERTTVFRNLGDGQFAPQPAMASLLPQQVRALTAGDIDADGDMDLVMTIGNGMQIALNDGGNANRWVKVAPRAQQIKGNESSASGRVNHLAIGSTLTLRAGGLDQTQLVRTESAHFGLGRRERADVVRILWTNGVPQNVLQPPLEGELCEIQTLKGSCPYLYTWTGERFEFLTDLLWNAPLGLQFGEGVLAPWRAWEYLKIPGDRLVADHGRYRLRITEELWEAAYFDQVRLFAVDHPADVQIYTNEKVGPAEIAGHRIHTVRQRRLPVAARDQRGRDVLPIVAVEDGNYLRAWDQRLRQGLTEPHFLELDLGPLDHPGRIVLFLTGWVYPSDTSINVALSQNPGLKSPRPPYLMTPGADGTWREALPYLGFPGGKTKTMAVDVTHAFAAGDYRLRIATTMEVHWDAAWFTVDEDPAKYRETELELLAAELHFRGVSARVWTPNNGPEVYDYSSVIPESPWPPLEGAFTRYGDVAPLLADWDDRMIVMGAGDEFSVEFAVPAEPPPGWVRDFVICCVGWDKDADLNTVYGQSSEPLPFRTMTDYALRDGAARELDAVYAQYLRTYQTRYQSRGRFRTGLRGLATPR